MGRWQPDARGRLVEAAMDLYDEQGFDATTVAEIARRAGLAERTFFRYFADKREVLFWGAAALEELLVGATEAAAGDLAPLEAVEAALQRAAVEVFADRRAFAARRHAVISASTELTERELAKLASLAEALGGALRRRGVGDPDAAVAGELGASTFKLAFQLWISGDAPTLGEAIDAVVQSARALGCAAAGGRAAVAVASQPTV